MITVMFFLWPYEFIMLLYNFFTVKNNQVFVIRYFIYDFWLVFYKAESGSQKWKGFRSESLVLPKNLKKDTKKRIVSPVYMTAK